MDEQWSPQTVRVYWASSGTFGPVPISYIIPGLPEERQRPLTYPVGMWIIEHPRGLVLYDTGMSVEISDDDHSPFWPASIVEMLTPRQRREDVIDRKLERLGFRVDQVRCVITSHLHADHGGNMRLFPDALHVVQRRELREGWWPERAPGAERGDRYVRASLEGTEDLDFMELDGDYDLFGDGSIQVLSTPGHTPGHQSVKLRTRNSGTIVLTGDACYMQEVLDGYLSGSGYDHDAFVRSLNRLKRIQELEGALLFFPHDEPQFAAMGERWYD